MMSISSTLNKDWKCGEYSPYKPARHNRKIYV